MVSSAEIESFVKSYSAAGFNGIRFAWNGKHSSEFSDTNQEYRAQVAAFVIDQPHKAPLALVRDLFLEEAKWCREAWGCSKSFPSLAEALVKKGGVAFLDDFLKGLMTSFDTFVACHQMNLRKYDVDEFSRAIEERLAKEQDKQIRALLESGRELFQKYRDGNASRGWVFLPPDTPVSNVGVVQPTIRQRIQRRLTGILKK